MDQFRHIPNPSQTENNSIDQHKHPCVFASECKLVANPSIAQLFCHTYQALLTEAVIDEIADLL